MNPLDNLSADINIDWVYTVSDLPLLIEWIYFAPGDGILWLLMQSDGLATSFELSQTSYGNWFSAIISALCWLIFMLILAIGRNEHAAWIYIPGRKLP
jgi:hypothetical protein